MAGRPRLTEAEIKQRTPRPGRGKTNCPKGHPYSGDNLYIDPAGNKRCRTCTRKALAAGQTRRPVPPVGKRGPSEKAPGRRRNQHSRKTHCPRGHPYSGKNLYIDPKGFRRCRQCKKDARRVTKPRAVKRPAPPRIAVSRPRKTHCPKGHPYAGENLYIDPKGNKRCRECKRLARR
jgi:hypothetical protein